MTGPDTINGLYEALGGFVLWGNVWKLHKDKQIRGVSILTSVFFTTWSIWNIYYYRHLDQFMSWSGGLVITAANLVWLAQMWRYRKN